MKLFTLLLGMLAYAGAAPAPAYDQAYPKASTAQVEIFTVPASRWLSTQASGSYFERSGELFGRLFDYISDNEIAMTVPVEGRLDDAEMRFHMSPDVTGSESTGSVQIVEAGARRVARLGGTGAYSQDNVAKIRAKVEQWIAANPEWKVSGPAYAVFWDGPMTPWFLKEFEVHVAIEPAG